ncbi:FAD-dependent oxidoreductase [Lutibacter sp.]|uniref:NAD(P)/FAD-dependent oxidoreductase n=1 Tax=Lutibacter sp. TaxID=1925666 RepID=UPI0025C43F44|nr:FAD-dependent oxidoreductase [Lutibacter sp.]MCF6181682.1 FAD-dependent oxidoreductase [Lutibacter sp.]
MVNREVDYIIVGLGLAGLTFSRILEKHKKSFIVFEDNSQNASLVASGMYNPVVLKRFTPVWKANSQLKVTIPFYQELEQLLQNKYNFAVAIYRVFKSVEEQNNWTVACDKPLLSNYMIPQIINKKTVGILSNFGFGKLKNTGRISTKLLLDDYKLYLKERNLIKYERFNYHSLKINKNLVEYENITAKNIIFCEGFGLTKNPFFNYLPMREAKGELLTIHTPELNIDFMIKSSVFVLPLGNHYYKVGATFNWKDKTLNTTQEGKQELIDKLSTVINVPYKIVSQSAGIRPTVKDRRPLVGKHPVYKNMAILNGLGTRGVMIAPWVAKQLFHHLENDKELDKEIMINRYQKLFSN